MNKNAETKTLRELRRGDWIAFDWINITVYGDPELTFIRGYPRTPESGAQAARDWDMWIDSARALGTCIGSE